MGRASKKDSEKAVKISVSLAIPTHAKLQRLRVRPGMTSNRSASAVVSDAIEGVKEGGV